MAIMKFEDNWKYKTLETLEKKIWPPLSQNEGSHLIKTCNFLSKKPLKDFTTEDLRVMIGQDIGLKYLIPLAIDILKSNIIAEGDLYNGDLLKSVLTSDKNYWQEERKNWKTICRLFEQNKKTLEECETTLEIKKGWFDSFNDFKSIN
jgi:hypothetical protein